MHAHAIVQRFLDTQLLAIHAARRRVLAAAVTALMQGSLLSLSRLARGICAGTGLKAALKRIDRLIGHRRSGQETNVVAGAILARLKAAGGPLLIAIDWSAVGPGGAFVELRACASQPGRGRAITIYQRVYPLAKLGNAKVERAFLDALHGWIGTDIEVIGHHRRGFRRPWFAHLERLGCGRVRRGVHLGARNARGRWCFASAGRWFARARGKARREADCRLTKRARFPVDVVLVRRGRTKRKPYRCPGHGSSAKAAREARVSAAEPWLLVHGAGLRRYAPERIVAFYAQRMQIEETFRDNKSSLYGLGQDIARSRSPLRLQAAAPDRHARRFSPLVHRPTGGSRGVAAPLQGDDARGPRTLDHYARAAVVRVALVAIHGVCSACALPTARGTMIKVGETSGVRVGVQRVRRVGIVQRINDSGH